MTPLEYKGYRAQVEVDLEGGLLFGRVLDIRAVITFAADRVDEVAAKFHEAIDDYLAWCKERGKDPERPFSGKFTFRTSSETHRLIAHAAEANRLSSNAWIEQVLMAAALAALHAVGESNITPIMAVPYSGLFSSVKLAQEQIPVEQVLGEASGS
jgi:predicted HicB family RNase H-like nuclease